jgi:hypothetical protein
MAVALRQGIDELSLTMKATLAVLAVASGVYTYLGVRDLLDGTASIIFSAPLSILLPFRSASTLSGLSSSASCRMCASERSAMRSTGPWWSAR